MKIFLGIFLFSLGFGLSAKAADTSAEFCARYKRDQLRIAAVMKSGWSADTQAEDQGDGAASREGCLKTPWLDQAANLLCGKTSATANQAIAMPKLILFYFDGTEYFRPKEAIALGAVNLTGKESGQMLDHGVAAWENDWIPDLRLAGVKWESDVEFHYHDGDGLAAQGSHTAMTCLNSLKQNMDDLVSLGILNSQNLPKLAIMGHSVGGSAAYNFAKKYKQPVDLLLLLDPVPKIGGYLLERIEGREFRLGDATAPANIKRIVNVYQESDTGSLGGVSAIRGSKVPSATKQVQLDMPPDEDVGHKQDHILMLSDPATIAIISEEFRTLIGIRGPRPTPAPSSVSSDEEGDSQENSSVHQ